MVFIGTLFAGSACAQTTLVNGANEAGALPVNATNLYTFTADKGDTLNLRLATTGFSGWLQLYGPDGARLTWTGGGTDVTIDDYTATNSGTFTVLVSSYFAGGNGTYVLRRAQIPETFTVPSGDEGGPLVNGANQTGTNDLADLDLWTFTANPGDTINLRLATTGFSGWLQLYGPDGARLTWTGGGTDVAIDDYTATNSGTFTVLVSSYFAGGTGTYVLRRAQFPGAFIVPPGDEGGGMNGSASYAGTLTLGDLDIWAFTACQGDLISLQLNTTNFYGKLQLYGSNGVLLNTVQGATLLNLAYTATNCGSFAALVSSYNQDDTGTYRLTVNGLADQMRLCSPVISGSRLTVNGVGGDPGTNCVLYSSTNLAQPFGLWTPVLTNQFNPLGVLTYTNTYDPASRQLYFRFIETE